MRRVLAGLACAVLGCGGSNGAPPSSGSIVDATVGPDGTAVDDGSAFSDSGSSGSFMADAPGPGRDYGPDATTFRPCDAGAGVGTSQCAANPPPVCTEGRYSVNYLDGTCTASGLCTWTKYDLDCFEFEGGICEGAIDAGFFPSSPEAGLFANANGCQVPVDPSLAPPAIGCDMDAGFDAGLCPPPHSVCTGAGGSGEGVKPEMVFYDDGECVGGQCFWQLGLVRCPDGCYNGGCVFPTTTPPPPNP